jgi:hypothetical protein
MDLFKFIPGSDPSYLVQGAFINKITNATWIERYRDAGEFTIKAPVSSNLRAFLPLGTFISHMATQEVMVVENAEIDDKVDEGEPEIVLTGRGLEAIALENRIVGQNIEHYAGELLSFFPYQLAFDTSWEQAKELIRLHINDEDQNLTDNYDGMVPISNQQHIGPSTTAARVIQPTTLYAAVLELLAIDDFGIKVVRPNADNVDPTTVEFRIHNGSDHSDSIIFSHVHGDLKDAKYLWSIRGLKTDYLCTSTYFAVRSTSAAEGWNRRVMYVDCTDMDQNLSDTDVGDGSISGPIGQAMYARGEQALKAQTETNILSTNISQSTRYKFRKDYEVGDIVFVRGNYNTASIMRVTEHVEFQDESGDSGYPTLSAVNEGA